MSFLSTASKIRIAGALYRVIASTRAAIGRSTHRVVCHRQGLRWNLDLHEGIPLGLYLGTFERATANALRRLLPPGGVAIDVGANVGAHALPMALHVGAGGRVIAIEPTATAFAELLGNLQLNPGLERILAPRQVAVVAPGESPPTDYYSSWPVTGGERAHAVHRGVLRSTTGAVVLTLDDLVAREELSRVDVLKIDVDGGEVSVLEGALDTLRTQRPALVLELCPYALDERATSLRELLVMLDAATYELVDERTFQPLSSDVTALQLLIPAGGSINVVALPRERQTRTVP